MIDYTTVPNKHGLIIGCRM